MLLGAGPQLVTFGIVVNLGVVSRPTLASIELVSPVPSRKKAMNGRLRRRAWHAFYLGLLALGLYFAFVGADYLGESVTLRGTIVGVERHEHLVEEQYGPKRVVTSETCVVKTPEGTLRSGCSGLDAVSPVVVEARRGLITGKLRVVSLRRPAP